MKVNIKKILVALVIINSFFLKANAQFSPADPGGDPGDVPIDDYLFPMLVFGFFLGIYFTYKNRNQSLTNK